MSAGLLIIIPPQYNNYSSLMNESGSPSLSPFDNGCLSFYFDNISIDDHDAVVEEAIDSDDSSCSRTACSSVFGSGIDELESESALFSSCSDSISKSNECLIGTSLDSTSLDLR